MNALFVGRDRELKVLTHEWGGSRAAFVPIYGRRRIGKSELILEFLRGRTGLYFLGQRAPAALQLAEFVAAVAAAARKPHLVGLTPRGWKEALELAVNEWPGPGKLVLALDEFQWMVEASPELPSVIQGLWDRQWREGGRVMLLLCGSYVGFMEREVLGRKSPLFGRRTAQIHLQPFGMREARQFHPAWSLADVARARFVCGGVPLYLRAFEADRSFAQNIRFALLDEFALLHREPEFLVREELRDVSAYAAVLSTLAAGSLPPAEIARRSGVPAQSVAYYLTQLSELGYVGRRQPLSGAPPSARAVRWRLTDPLLRFWYRFVFPQASLIRQFGPERALSDLVLPRLPSWEGSAFEELCREALPALYADEGVTGPAEVGEFWGADTQVDVVGVRGDDRLDLGECRWGEVGSRGEVVAALRAKVARVPNPRGATVGLRVFTRNRIPPDRAVELGVKWHGLADLYAEAASPRGTEASVPSRRSSTSRRSR